MPHRLFLLCGLVGAVSLAAAQDSTPAGSARGGVPKPQRARAALADQARRQQALREFLQKLPPEKRQQVLAAVRRVWDDDEVRAARDRLKSAIGTYKRAMREAIDETDPEVRDTVRPLLERLIKEGLAPGQRSGPAERAPRLQRLFGLDAETVESLTPEERRLLASVRERVAADDRVRTALAKLELAADQPGGRGAALRELRRTARAVAVEFEPRLAPLLDRVPAPPADPGAK